MTGDCLGSTLTAIAVYSLETNGTGWGGDTKHRRTRQLDTGVINKNEILEDCHIKSGRTLLLLLRRHGHRVVSVKFTLGGVACRRLVGWGSGRGNDSNRVDFSCKSVTIDSSGLLVSNWPMLHLEEHFDNGTRKARPVPQRRHQHSINVICTKVPDAMSVEQGLFGLRSLVMCHWPTSDRVFARQALGAYQTRKHDRDSGKGLPVSLTAFDLQMSLNNLWRNLMTR